jgi:hypothetical protein
MLLAEKWWLLHLIPFVINLAKILYIIKKKIGIKNKKINLNLSYFEKFATE